MAGVLTAGWMASLGQGEPQNTNTWDCFDRSRGVSILVYNSTILLEIDQSGYQFNRLSKMNISEIGLQKAVDKLCPMLSFFVDMGLL